MVQNTSTRGEVYAQGRVAPGVLRGATAPVGEVGGPLKGSSLMGAIPANWVLPQPKFENPLLALGLILAASQQPPEPPEPDVTPVISALNPSTAEIGSADLVMTVTGTGFINSSVIVFNGGDEATDYVSDTEVSTGVRPSTATVAGAFPVLVRNGTAESNALDFTFTEVTTLAREADEDEDTKSPKKKTTTKKK